MDFFDSTPASGYYPLFALAALNDRLSAASMVTRMIAAFAVAVLTCR